MTFYYRELSAQLRLRQTPEVKITEVLREVKQLCDVSRQPPEQQFGTATEYASTFPQLSGRTVAVKALLVVVGVCLLMQAYFLFRWQVLGHGSTVPVLLLLVATQGVALVGSFASNYRLPKGFELTNDKTA